MRTASAPTPRTLARRFRLGVALRRRFDGPKRHAGDAQAAVEAWGRALTLDPGQYIWRRRIQQYGPRLDKPYNFYFWIEAARKEISARGEKPVTLSVEPRGSEIAPPRRGDAAATKAPVDPDPLARIPVDKDRLVQVETIVTPARVRPGERVRVRFAFRLNDEKKPHWNNESSGLYAWVEFGKQFKLEEGIFQHVPPSEPETREDRVLEFEALVSQAAKGTLVIPAAVHYDVCLDVEGVCYRYRQDVQLKVVVDEKAPRIR